MPPPMHYIITIIPLPPDNVSSIVLCLDELLSGFHDNINPAFVGLELCLKRLMCLQLGFEMGGVLRGITY